MTAAARMLATLPPYEADDPSVRNLMTALGAEHDRLSEAARTTILHLFPQNADDTTPHLQMLEALFGLPVPAGASVPQRQTNVLAHLRNRVSAAGLTWIARLSEILGNDWAHQEVSPYTILISVPYVQGTFPRTSVLDAFTRANENPLAGSGAWAGPIIPGNAQLKLLTNAASPQTNGVIAGGYRVAQVVAPEAEAYMTLGNNGGAAGRTHALWVKLQNPNTVDVRGYYAWFNVTDDTIEIGRADSSSSLIPLGATISQTLAVGDVVGLACLGDQVTTWVNGVIAGVRTDATYSNVLGYIGAQAYYPFDDYGGGAVSIGVSASQAGRFARRVTPAHLAITQSYYSGFLVEVSLIGDAL